MYLQKRNNMATDNQIKELGNAIGFLSVADIKGLSLLINKYGGNGNIISYKNLNKQAIMLLGNKSFYQEFVRLVSSNLKLLEEMNANASGFYNMDAFANSNGNSTTPATTGGGFFSGFNLQGLLNIGSTIYGSTQESKRQSDLLNAQANQNAQQLQAQIDAGNLTLEAERLKLAQIQALQGQGGAKNNTMLYVGLGVLGLLVVGGVIYAVVKK
jgi:hypothetical protein